MDLASFRTTLAADQPETGMSPPLQALWWTAKGDWTRAHEIVQAQDDDVCAWVHAYLHRVEGDLSNARYWYRRAERPEATEPLDAEWATIAQAVLMQNVGA